MITCLYDRPTGQFNGLTLRLAYIVLRGDLEEFFLSYGVDKQKSNIVLFIRVVLLFNINNRSQGKNKSVQR